MSQPERDMLREKLLVLGAMAREEGAFQQLVELYQRRMLYYLHRFLGSDADLADVMQEIWLRVFQRIATLRAPEAFRVWLYKIAHDVAASHLRRSRRRETKELKVAPEAASDWNELELLEDAEWVHQALERLSPPHREVMTLRFLEQLELAEIAQVTGCGVGTVKSRLHYAKSALRSLLESQCHE